jgi:hypothetical protein
MWEMRQYMPENGRILTKSPQDGANSSRFLFHRVDLKTNRLHRRDKKEKFVARLTILLDLGGVIMDKRQQTEQWHSLIGEYFAPLFGRTIHEWNTAHHIVTERLLD